jgi:choline kinase
MKAIVLSAGQGKRLLPYTLHKPKCLVSVDGERPVLEVQLRALARCGVDHATVLVGFGASEVDRFVATTPIPNLVVETLYNPFYSLSDNLATCWVARHWMDSDFVLLNGDTIFEDLVLRRVLEGPPSPVTVLIDHKESYDDDDMKVSIDEDGRLLAIGKTLKPEIVNGESIGLLCFRGSGPRYFRGVVERTMREPEALRAWYLSVVNEIAQDTSVDTVSVRGLWWREIDEPTDLEEARRSFPARPDRPATRLSAVGKGS